MHAGTHSIGLAVVFLATILSGCQGLFGPADCANQPRTPGSGDQPFAGWELKVLSHGAWSWTYDAVKPGFEQATGAKLTEIEGPDAGGALQEAILNHGNPVADVIWGIDNALFHKARQEGVLHAYTSPNSDRILDYIETGQFTDENGQLLATPADHGYIAVNYDVRLRQDHAPDELPKTLADLATPQWASQFVTQDPRTSSPGLGFLVATVATFGETGAYTWQNYWTDLFENGVLVTSDWTQAYTYHYSANGFGVDGAPLDRTIVTSYTTSPAAEVYFGSFDEVNAVSLEPPRGVFHQIETAAILACTPNLPLAKAFIDYVLTPEFQSTIPDTQAIYPIIKGVQMPAAYQDLATDPSQLEPASFSANDLGVRLPQWVQSWETLFERHHA